MPNQLAVESGAALSASKIASWFEIVPQAPIQQYRMRSKIALCVAILCVAGLLSTVIVTINQAALLEDAPVEFSRWSPDKNAYGPGDQITFSYSRSLKDQNLIAVQIDSLQNLDTGAVYQGAVLAGRVQTTIKEPETRTAVRFVPLTATSGTYKLIGCVLPKTQRASMAASYESYTFHIVSSRKAAAAYNKEHPRRAIPTSSIGSKTPMGSNADQVNPRPSITGDDTP